MYCIRYIWFFSISAKEKAHLYVFTPYCYTNISQCQCLLFHHCNKGWRLWYIVGVFSCVLSHTALTFGVFLHTNSQRLWWHLSRLVSWSHYLFSLCSNVHMLDVYNQKKIKTFKSQHVTSERKGTFFIHLTSLHSCWALVNEEGSIFALQLLWWFAKVY